MSADPISTIAQARDAENRKCALEALVIDLEARLARFYTHPDVTPSDRADIGGEIQNAIGNANHIIDKLETRLRDWEALECGGPDNPAAEKADYLARTI